MSLSRGPEETVFFGSLREIPGSGGRKRSQARFSVCGLPSFPFRFRCAKFSRFFEICQSPLSIFPYSDLCYNLPREG